MRTFERARRAAASCLLLAGLIFCQLPVGAQTGRAPARPRPSREAGRTQTPAEKVVRAASQPGVAAGVVLSSAARGRQMAAPYESGRLPAPARRPAGDADEVAAALAKMVSARDEQSVPALLAALLAAGFGLRDSGGGVTQTVQPGQGLAFDEWEVAAAAKMYGERREVELTYLTEGLRAIPALKSAPLDRMLLEGIRRHAQDAESPLRFWARFIVELGRRADRPYDLLGAADPKGVRLDAVQAALVLRRLHGDLAARGQGAQRAALRRRGDAAPRPAYLRAALFGDPPARFLGARAPLPAATPQGGPCAEMMSGDTGTILDGAATAITTAWGEILSYVAGQAGSGTSAADTAGKFLSVANIILAYAQFIATYAALETEITMENSPLVRTKNTQAGELRRFKAKVTLNMGKWDQVNCFRTALNVATGLDFKLLNDGPVEGAELTWKLEQPDGVVAHIHNPGPRFQDAGAYAGVPGGVGVAVTDFRRTKTDQNGEATIQVEGAPKQPPAVGKIRPVMKEAVIYTTVKMKGGDLKGDAVDVMGQALGGAGALITMPVELLYRMSWAVSGSLAFPVKDHERCEGEWYGQITFNHAIKFDERFQDAKQTNHATLDEQYQGTIELTGERLNFAHQPYATIGAEVRARANRSETRYGRGTTENLCNLEKRMNASISGEAERVGQEATVSIVFEDDGRYVIIYKLPGITAKGERSNSTKVMECKNPFIKPTPQRSTPVQEEINPLIVEIEGKLDPNNPDVIKGSKTVTETGTRRRGDKSTAVVTWDLARCN